MRTHTAAPSAGRRNADHESQLNLTIDSHLAEEESPAGLENVYRWYFLDLNLASVFPPGAQQAGNAVPAVLRLTP